MPTSQRQRPRLRELGSLADSACGPRPSAGPHTSTQTVHPPLPQAHVRADLRQPGEQVENAGDGADDEADDFLPSEGLEGKGCSVPNRPEEQPETPGSLGEGHAHPPGHAEQGPWDTEPVPNPPSTHQTHTSPYCLAPRTGASGPGRPCSVQSQGQRPSAAERYTPLPG